MIWHNHLNEIHEMGALLMTPREIAQNLQMPVCDVIEELNDENSEFYEQFFGGVMQTKMKHAQDVNTFKNTSDENRILAERIMKFDEQLVIQLY
jgi:hypothetical protein